MTRKIAGLALVTILLCFVQKASYAKSNEAVQRYYQNKRVIKNQVAYHLNQCYKSNKYFGRIPYDFGNIDKKGGKYYLSSLEIEAPWALAVVTPRRWKPPEPFVPDGAAFVLKKQKGQWRILGMGTNLHGLGKKYGVPKCLWKKWFL